MTGLLIEKTRENIMVRFDCATDVTQLDSIIDDALEVIPREDKEFWDRLEEKFFNLI